MILLFWTVQFLVLSADRLARSPELEGWANFQARLIVTALGALLSFLILEALERATGTSFLKRALLAFALAIAGASIHGVANLLVFWSLVGPPPGETLSAAAMAPYLPSLVFFFSWIYLAVALVLLSLTYSGELLRREQRIAELTLDADRARLKALRYQLNPHFLFNALNSAASLVSSRRNPEAELMLENLADYLRATLKLGAGKEITLREELGLQSLYLDVEAVRFPKRLRVEKDVPEDLQDVLVPNLITQPLIENTIKHAVAQSSTPVCLKIAACEVAGKLQIEVGDDGGNAGPSEAKGTGVGLRNVADRLNLHYREDAHFEAGRTAQGGFETRLSIPIRRKQ